MNSSRNTNLSKAKNAKNDEFYTRLENIEKELNSYNPKIFKNKTVFCNCDDPTNSNFWVFFHMNFNRLGLKKLITTHYNSDDNPSYTMTYDSKDPKNDIDFSKGTKIPLKGNGDFRSDECIGLLKQSDLIITNPPFSLFREFVAQLEKYNKQFIIWGNNNAITYKEIFPLIKERKLWLGYCVNKTCYFKLSPDYSKWDEKFTAKMNDGYHYGKVPAISIFTNVDTTKRHCKLDTVYRWRKRKEKYPDLYPKYSNYDAIEVSKVLQIPLDYNGLMGVPITFLDVYNPDQFEIIGYSGDLAAKMNSIALKGTYQTGGRRFYSKKITNHDKSRGFKYHRHYDRIVIRNKHPEDYMHN